MDLAQVSDISNSFAALRELTDSLTRAAAGWIPVGSERRELLRRARSAGPAALPTLFRSLTSGSELEATWAHFVLSRLGGARIIDRVSSIAADRTLSDHTRTRAIRLLTELRAPAPAEVTLGDPDLLLRSGVLALLDAFERGKSDVEMIFEQVADADLPLFASELCRHGGTRALGLVGRLLESDSLPPAVRRALERIADGQTAAKSVRPDGAALERGLNYLEAGRPQAARAHLQRFVGSRPAHPEGQSALGVCLLELGLAEEALVHLRLAAELDAAEPLHHWNLASAYEHAKRHGGCYLALRDYLALYDDGDQAHERRAEASAFVGAYERALLEAGAVPLSDMLHGPQRLARAHATLLEARPSEAACQFEAIVSCEPNHHLSWTHLGSAYLALGRTTEARACLERALMLAPDFALARRKLANLKWPTAEPDPRS
jgi:tetratricopeptide (TPR) repeat protein